MQQASLRALALGAAGVFAGCGGLAPEPDLELPMPFVQALRPDDPFNGELHTFDLTEVVETFDSPGGSFRVHFTRNGSNEVASDDADGSGVPDFVEEVAAAYDEVIVHYRDTLGFDPPRSDAGISHNGGDGRFDVYLIDFAGVGDGVFRRDADGCDPSALSRCAGYMVQENDYAGYGYPSTAIANRILASHELFHAVQASYDADQGSVVSEGSAVWATESFDGSLADFEAFVDGYLGATDRPIDQPPGGPVPSFSYGAGIVFRFLQERFGADLIREMWEGCVDGAAGVDDPVWTSVLDRILTDSYGSSFAEAFAEFVQWNLFTGLSADPARGYAEGAGYPPVHHEPVSLPYVDDRLRVYYASSQYYRGDVGTRAELTAALAGAPEEMADLRMWIVPRSGTSYGAIVELTELEAGTEVIDVTAADRAVVLIANTALEGASRHPGLCIGTREEVATCRDLLDPTVAPDGGPSPGDSDAPSGDSDPPLGDDEPAGGDAATGGGSSGGGCAAASVPMQLGMLLGVLFSLRQRGRRRRRR